MRWFAFTKRTAQEIILDPLTVAFGLGMPVALLLLLTAINNGVPEGYGPDNFKIQYLTPGVNVFAMSFLTLMAGLLLSKDRGSSLLQRLLTTPLTAVDYIVGYMLPLIPIALLQGIICYAFALILGLPFTVNIVWAILISLISALMFSAMGLLFGTILHAAEDRDRLYKRLLLVSGCVMAAYLAASFHFGALFLCPDRVYYALSPLEAAGLLSIDLTLLSAFYFLLKRVPAEKLRIPLEMSRNLTQIYLIHWCVLGFIDSIFCYLLEFSFSWPVIYGIGAALIVLSAWIAKRWEERKRSLKAI